MPIKKSKIKKPISLGNKVRDIVTGFTGIAVSDIVYLNGCRQFGIKGEIKKDGTRPETEYIDVGQLEFVDKGVSIEQFDTGGDQPDAPKF